MRDRMQALWDDVVPLGVACPQADPAAVKRRVNAGSPAGQKLQPVGGETSRPSSKTVLEVFPRHT